MKKGLNFLSLAVAFSLMTSNVFASVQGDIDGDGRITATDVAMVFNNPELGNGYSVDEILKKALDNDYIMATENEMKVEIVTTGSAVDIVTSTGAVNVTFTDSDNNVATPVAKSEQTANQFVYVLNKNEYTVNVDVVDAEKYNVTVNPTKVTDDAKIIVKIDLK